MPTINRRYIAIDVFTRLSYSNHVNVESLLLSLKDSLTPTVKESFYFITLNRLLKLLVEYDNDRIMINPGAATNNLRAVWPEIICHIVTKLANQQIDNFNLHEFDSLYSMIFHTVLLGGFPRATISNSIHEKFRVKHSIARLINYAFIANEFQRPLHINLLNDFNRVFYSENTTVECLMEYSNDKFSQTFLQSMGRMTRQKNYADDIDSEIKSKTRSGQKVSIQKSQERNVAVCQHKVLFNEVFFSFFRVLSEIAIPEYQTPAQNMILKILNYKLESMFEAHIKRWGNPVSLFDCDLLMALRDTSFKWNQKQTSLLLESSRDQLTNLNDQDPYSLKTLLCLFETLNSSKYQSDYESMLHKLRQIWPYIINHIVFSFIRNNQRGSNIDSEDFNNLYRIICHTFKLDSFQPVTLNHELYDMLKKVNTLTAFSLTHAYIANNQGTKLHQNLLQLFISTLGQQHSAHNFLTPAATDVFSQLYFNLRSAMQRDADRKDKAEITKKRLHKIQLVQLITALKSTYENAYDINKRYGDHDIYKFKKLNDTIEDLKANAIRYLKSLRPIVIRKRMIQQQPLQQSRMSIVSTVPKGGRIENPNPPKRLRR